MENYIIINNKYFKIENLPELLEFTRTKEFEYLSYKIFKFLSKKRKLETVNVNDIFKNTDNDEINYLNLDDSFIPVNKLLLDSAFNILERKVGQKLMNEFLSYDDVLNFQAHIKNCRDYFNDKGLPNFTHGQAKGSKIKYEKFMESQDSLKKYTKLFCKKNN